MAVTFTREFWTNFVLFVVACVALALSIWAFATPCKKDGFKGLFNYCCPNPNKCMIGCQTCDKNETCQPDSNTCGGICYPKQN